MGTLRYSAEGAVGRGLSPAIWQKYGLIGGNFKDPSLIPFFFDDFADLGVMASTVSQGGYITLQEGASTIQQAAAADNSEEEFGVLEIGDLDADNEEASIELGAAVAGLVRMDDTPGERAVVVAECRIKRTTVTDNHTAFSWGLGIPGWAITNALADDDGGLYAAGTMKSFVGFETLAASNEEVDAVYAFDSASKVAITDNAGTAVADTWQKLGIVFDPLAPTDEKLKLFIDGVEISYDTAVTDVIIAAASAFPTDVELTLVLLTKNCDGTPTNHPVYMDWWAVGSYPVDV